VIPLADSVIALIGLRIERSVYHTDKPARIRASAKPMPNPTEDIAAVCFASYLILRVAVSGPILKSEVATMRLESGIGLRAHVAVGLVAVGVLLSSPVRAATVPNTLPVIFVHAFCAITASVAAAAWTNKAQRVSPTTGSPRSVCWKRAAQGGRP
jgi:hypothetical protein